MTSIGVIGAGSHSRNNHGAAFKAVKADAPAELELAAVCDLDADKARQYAADYGFARTYTDIAAMLAAEQLDALVAVTPITLTRQIAGDLLPHGIPLLMEKPPGLHLGETRELLEIARQTGTPHMISFNRRFCPAVLGARQWLADNALDRPVTTVQAQMLRVHRREADFVTGTGIHLIDAVLSFMPRPLRLASRRLPPSGRTDVCANSWTTQLAFADGAAAQLHIAPDCGRHAETYELFGPEYAVHIDAVDCRLQIQDQGETVVEWQPPADAESAYKVGAVDETRAFLEAVEANAGFRPALAEGLISMLVSDAVQRGVPELDIPTD